MDRSTTILIMRLKKRTEGEERGGRKEGRKKRRGQEEMNE